jgi:hypothetical protein
MTRINLAFRLLGNPWGTLATVKVFELAPQSQKATGARNLSASKDLGWELPAHAQSGDRSGPRPNLPAPENGRIEFARAEEALRSQADNW